MSNLKIAFADIPYNSLDVTASAALSGFSSAYDVIAGERSYSTGLAVDDTTCSYTFDLGTAYASGQASADYFIVAHADDCDIQTGTTAKLQRSSDGAAWTDVCDSSATGSLVGPRDADYYAAFNQVGPYRYWRALFSSAGAVPFQLSKIYTGLLFDVGVNPDYLTEIKSPSSTSWYATSGAAYSMRNAEPFYRVDLKWEGVTDAKALSFDQNVIANARECPVFLIATAEPKILDYNSVIHAKLVNANVTNRWNNYNVIEASFEELVA